MPKKINQLMKLFDNNRNECSDFWDKTIDIELGMPAISIFKTEEYFKNKYQSWNDDISMEDNLKNILGDEKMEIVRSILID